jgi:hypothetical protein
MLLTALLLALCKALSIFERRARFARAIVVAGNLSFPRPRVGEEKEEANASWRLGDRGDLGDSGLLSRNIDEPSSAPISSRVFSEMPLCGKRWKKDLMDE